jgi:hypothetical protein
MGKVKVELLNMHEALLEVVTRLEDGLNNSIPAEIVLDNLIDYLTDAGYMNEYTCECGGLCGCSGVAPEEPSDEEPSEIIEAEIVDE